ncbi:MAG: hypothetical protein ABI604_07125 [Nitrospirota bacterium]
MRQDVGFAVTGIAFAGRRGFMKVEVSLDDGGTLLCELVTGEKLHVCWLWGYEWGKPTAGQSVWLDRCSHNGERVHQHPRSASR